MARFNSYYKISNVSIRDPSYNWYKRHWVFEEGTFSVSTGASTVHIEYSKRIVLK